MTHAAGVRPTTAGSGVDTVMGRVASVASPFGAELPMRYLVLIASIVLLASCKPVGQPGDACTVTGDGFTREDSCSTMCVEWEITCPSGDTVTPDVCSGDLCAATGSCPDGYECLVVDSVPSNARCMPVAVCGGVPGAPTLPEPAVLR